ncbi:MAG: hypothetical protein R3C19_04185 [Planctomycetaceae bacterium]
MTSAARVRLLTFDFLPLNCAACFGGNPPESIGVLDRLAMKSVVFENHYLQRPAVAEPRDVFGDTHVLDNAQRLVLTASSPAGDEFLSEADRRRLADAALAWLHVQMPDTDESSGFGVREYIGRAVSEAESLCRQHDILILTACCGLTAPDLGRFETLLPEAAIRVPLLLMTGTRDARRVQTITGSFDLAPTLADALTLSPPDAGNSSVSPVSLLRILNSPREFAGRCLVIETAESLAIRNAEFLFVQHRTDLVESKSRGGSDRPVALYAKPEDVWNVHDVSVEYPEAVREFQSLLLSCR